jgi:hypothetical protein
VKTASSLGSPGAGRVDLNQSAIALETIHPCTPLWRLASQRENHEGILRKSHFAQDAILRQKSLTNETDTITLRAWPRNGSPLTCLTEYRPPCHCPKRSHAQTNSPNCLVLPAHRKSVTKTCCASNVSSVCGCECVSWPVKCVGDRREEEIVISRLQAELVALLATEPSGVCATASTRSLL